MSGQKRKRFFSPPPEKPEDHAFGFGGVLHQVRSRLLPPLEVPSDCLYLSLEKKIWPQFSNRITKAGKCSLPCGPNYTAIGG